MSGNEFFLETQAMACKWRKNHDLTIDPLQSCAAFVFDIWGVEDQ
jgi:hypothetical protein